ERPCEMQAAAFRLADRSQQPRRSTGKIAPGTQERRKRHKGLRPPVLFSADAELGEQRQVIGGDQGLAAAMQQELLQHKVTIEVHVVQVHDREHSGISATAVEVELNVDALKLTLQHARHQPGGPLVEVAQQQARVLKRRRQKDIPAHQHARSPAPFYVSRTQVNIEYVNDPAVCDFQVTTDASP